MSAATAELGSVCHMDRRTTAASGAIGSGLEFVGMEHVDPDTGRIAPGQGSRTGEGKGQAFLFDDRHVLFGKLRPYLRKIALPQQPGCASTELVPLLPDASRLDRSYLFHWVRQQSVIDALMAKNTGARMPRADMTVLLDMTIPLPPLEEQRRIVGLLDRAAEIRCRADAARAKARAMIPALFLDMFGDPATNPKGWPIRTLAELGELDRGRSRHRPRNAPELYGGAHPFVQTGDVANSGGRIRHYEQTYSDVGLSQSRMWPAGTLCITIAANIGKTGILEFAACFPDSVVGFTPGAQVTSEFVQTTLDFMQAAIEDRAPQAAQKNINLQVLRGLDMMCPPFSLQNAFSEQAQRLEATTRALDAATTKAEAIGAALSAEMFDASPNGKDNGVDGVSAP